MADLRIKNARAFTRALKQVDADAAKQLQRAVREAAKPVAAQAVRLAERYGSAVATGIRPGSRSGVGTVRQTRRKTTGQHPNFGGLLMRTALEPALAALSDQAIREMEAALDRAAAAFNQGGPG